MTNQTKPSHTLLFSWPAAKINTTLATTENDLNLRDEKKLNPNFFSPTFYLGPVFNPMDTIQTLVKQLNESLGGAIDQSSLYIDPMSSLDWLEVERQSDYQSAQNDIPLNEVADLVSHLYHEFYPADEIDLIFLGPGGGEKEVLLSQYLAPYFKKIRIFLIDVSQPLLAFSYRNMVASLKEFTDKVEIFAIMADMHDLHLFLHLLSPSAPNRKRLVSMMGYTFSNLENELLFVRNSLRALEENDLFFVDMPLAVAPADQPDLIRQREPRLAQTIPPGWNNAIDRWLSSTILRYARGVKSIQFINYLDMATCCIPGSYSIEKRARLTFEKGSQKEFTVQRFKRYDANKLILRMKEEGWAPGGGWIFGKVPEKFSSDLGYLFKRSA